jgi:hypothetical protein
MHLIRLNFGKEMAGTAGLEPANAGIKTPCLNQLGDVPAELSVAAGGLGLLVNLRRGTL